MSDFVVSANEDGLEYEIIRDLQDNEFHFMYPSCQIDQNCTTHP